MDIPNPRKESKPKSIVCMYGHPDDPEAHGGGIFKFTSLGHQYLIIYRRPARQDSRKSLPTGSQDGRWKH